MKKFLVLLLIMLIPTVFAQVPNQAPALKKELLPQGTFKKKHNGDIVQYDKNGKKIGVYKMQYGKMVRVK